MTRPETDVPDSVFSLLSLISKNLASTETGSLSGLYWLEELISLVSPMTMFMACS
jgi:hypothetical protein